MSADVGNVQQNFQPGDQFSIDASSGRNDAWCQSDTNVIKPVMSFMVCDLNILV